MLRIGQKALDYRRDLLEESQADELKKLLGELNKCIKDKHSTESDLDEKARNLDEALTELLRAAELTKDEPDSTIFEHIGDAHQALGQADKAKAAAKVEKWRSVCIESIKQCGYAWLPTLEMPMKPSTAIEEARAAEVSLIATLQSDAKHPRAHIDAYAAENGQAPKKLAIWVGPEGDYTPAEINTIRTGALPITLGPLVLRSETAAIYCLAILNYELQARP